jgi:hypothetical protein
MAGDKAFRERVYSGGYDAASVLKTLLESEGIQILALGDPQARRLDRQEIFVLNEAQIDRARDIVAHFLAGEPLVDPKTHKSWRCTSCNELIEGQFTECWKCGGPRQA